MKTAGIFWAFDLLDQFGHIGGGRFGLSADPLLGQDLHAVFLAEIAQGIVRGDDDAVICRDGGDRRLDLGIQRVDLSEIGLGVGLVGGFAGRIGSDQSLGDIDNIGVGIGHTLPGMGSS